VKQFTVGDDDDVPQGVTNEQPRSPEELMQIIHFTQPARYRHPEMEPFDEKELADIESFKYHGYIPVDHSVFTEDQTFDGLVDVDLDITPLGDITQYYIDEVADKDMPQDA